MPIPEGEEGQDGSHSDAKAKASRAVSDPEAHQSVASSIKQPTKANLQKT